MEILSRNWDILNLGQDALRCNKVVSVLSVSVCATRKIPECYTDGDIVVP